MKFCIYCGTQLEDDVQFCPNCGAPVNEQPAQTTTQTTQNTQTGETASAKQNTVFTAPEQTAFSASPVQPVQDQKYNGFAIAALVLGIVSCVVWACCLNTITCILAIIFGILALVQIKKNSQKGKGMAITGLILGIVMVIVFVALFAYTVVMAASEGWEEMFDSYYYDDYYYDDYYYDDYYDYDFDYNDFLNELDEA